ncbi:MAG: phospho-N-acetylmuramoyl-pentapeptide-transferase [Chitinophagales bacterium]|nr:phospho-N-acetylmuramoyl-pentapeptide-transferase [Chitinophagales bacterium]MDW8428743.1 phospho-N-acetylmuramoyl-pentapeptide-transferase [Chitinophagales bacterium]
MLYYLFEFLDERFDLPGAGLFGFISFRAGMAIILSLLIGLFFGKWMLKVLRRKQVGESIRDLGLQGQMEKEGTPTMGGLIILAAILIPTLLFAKLHNIYVLLLLATTLWCGLIGFVDDYIKVFKKNKRGLTAWSKLFGQITLGILVGSILYFHSDVVVRRPLVHAQQPPQEELLLSPVEKATAQYVDAKLPITTIPFVKNHEFNYGRLLSWINREWERYTWVVYILIVVIIITAVSNAANITDGMDGLATGVSAIAGATLGIFAYVSGNILLADYLNIMYIPNSGELLVFSAAFIGACVGFLWYNAYPAQVFMGDTGSLALGGIIATLAITVRKELLLPLLCGIFLIENLSVIIQVAYFKYTRWRYGAGRRVFRMAPLHHHYQVLGYPEPKIVTRFWIVGMLLAVLTLVTLKIR